MSSSEATRAAAKKAQLARLAAKRSPDYPKVYAAQPEQVRIAAEQGAARKAVRDAKLAIDAVAASNAAAATESFSSLSTKKGDK